MADLGAGSDFEDRLGRANGGRAPVPQSQLQDFAQHLHRGDEHLRSRQHGPSLQYFLQWKRRSRRVRRDRECKCAFASVQGFTRAATP